MDYKHIMKELLDAVFGELNPNMTSTLKQLLHVLTLLWENIACANIKTRGAADQKSIVFKNLMETVNCHTEYNVNIYKLSQMEVTLQEE